MEVIIIISLTFNIVLGAIVVVMTMILVNIRYQPPAQPDPQLVSLELDNEIKRIWIEKERAKLSSYKHTILKKLMDGDGPRQTSYQQQRGTKKAS